MSLEKFDKAYPNGLNFRAKIIRRPEFQQGYSEIGALADTMYHEGAAGLKDVVRDIRKKGKVPTDPFSYEMPVEFADRVDLNGAAVLFGSLFRTVEIAVVDRVYDPRKFAEMLRKGFKHTPWKKDFNFDELREPQFLSHESIAPLTHLATVDRRFTFLFTQQGLHHLPSSLAQDLESMQFYEPMQADFASLYLTRSSLLMLQRDAEKPKATKQGALVQNKPLTFR